MNDAPDLPWWQALLGGLGALLMGWGAALQHGKRASADLATRDDIEKMATAAHERTRAEFHASLIEALREERSEFVEMVRREGSADRELLRSAMERLGLSLAVLERGITLLLDRSARHPDNGNHGKT